MSGMNRRYPEWFIGGPWHGRDKLKECPHLQSIVRVASVVPSRLDVRELLSRGDELPDTTVVTNPITEEYVYSPRRVDVFGEGITVWVGDNESPRLDERGQLPEWVQMLGQLLLSPHRLTPGGDPFDVAPYARIHRDRWETERQIRRELQQQYQDELNRLRSTVSALSRQVDQHHRASDRRGLRHDEIEMHLDPDDACIFRINIEGKVTFVRFEDITLYEDPGDDENPPGWVATGQAPYKNASGEFNDTGFTGFAEDKTGAILALVADRLGHYARLTAYGDRGRIR